MDENPDKKAADKKSDKPPAVKKQSPAATAKSRRIMSIMPTIIAVLALALAVAGGVYIYQQVESNRMQTASVLQRSESLQQDINQQVARINADISRLANEQKALTASLTELYQQQPESNEDWALSEVEYLLIIASHRLILERDVNTALAAMEAAALRLQALSGPDLIPVREQLTADINKLRAVNTVDTVGMAIYLADLVERAAELPVRKPADDLPGKAGNEEQSSAGTESGWRNILAVFWQELKSLIVIKKSGEIRQALLMPDEEYFLSQNLRLELENARLAVLRHDTENLRTSIALILDWLQRYYETSDAAVSNIMDTLIKMQGVELQPQLPDISSSLETLRAYMRQG